MLITPEFSAMGDHITYYDARPISRVDYRFGLFRNMFLAKMFMLNFRDIDGAHTAIC